MTEQQERKYRGFLWLLLLAGIAALLFSIYFSYWNKIPSQIRIRAGVEQEFDFRVPVSGEIYRMPEEAAPVASVTDVDEKDEAFLLAGEENSADSIHVDFARTVKLKANQIDSYQMNLKLFGVLPYKNVDIEVIQDKMLIPSGIPIGIYVKCWWLVSVSSRAAAGRPYPRPSMCCRREIIYWRATGSPWKIRNSLSAWWRIPKGRTWCSPSGEIMK